MANSSTIRLLREIKDLQTGSDLSLAVAHRDDNVRNVRALIIGPPDTPYEFGFFEFNVKFGDKYPTQSPEVRCLTTNCGRCRFNPNIYASGKVCLSILGTWRGEQGEQWSTAQGLESLLISIQSLMSANPFENEPGYEGIKLSTREAEHYAAKIGHESLRITVIQRLEEILQISNTDDPFTSAELYAQQSVMDEEHDDNDAELHDPDAEADKIVKDVEFDPFVNLYKLRFLWYYDAYLKAIEDASHRVMHGTRFEIAPFEYFSNSMQGKYAYPSLKSRLERIYNTLEAETATWAENGKAAMEDGAEGNGTAANLNHQFEQYRRQFSESSGSSVPVELSLVDKNPFVWTLTFFGASETDLYGATINVRLNFPLDFPEHQPRVTVLTRLFHHRISASARILCYFPTKPWDVRSHIESIMDTIQEENPAYDPRTLVNPEASVLIWGNESQKRQYRRKLRRSVQDCMDNPEDF